MNSSRQLFVALSINVVAFICFVVIAFFVTPSNCCFSTETVKVDSSMMCDCRPNR